MIGLKSEIERREEEIRVHEILLPLCESPFSR